MQTYDVILISYLHKQPRDKHWDPGVSTLRGFPCQSQNTACRDLDNKSKVSLSVSLIVPNPINNSHTRTFFPFEKVNTACHLLSNEAFQINMSPLGKWHMMKLITSDNFSHLRWRPSSADGWILKCRLSYRRPDELDMLLYNPDQHFTAWSLVINSFLLQERLASTSDGFL